MDIVTLATEDYTPGVVALINSLASVGFDGRIIVGCPQPLELSLKGAHPVTFRNISQYGSLWPGNYKAALLSELEDGDYCYIDADCIVTSNVTLDVVSEALEKNAVFAVEGLLPVTDIRRQRWHEFYGSALATRDAAAEVGQSIYINSGVLAVRLPRDRELLARWQGLIERCLSGRGDMYETRFFPMPDQDCLNAVLQSGTFRFTTIGPPDVWYRALQSNPFFHVGIGMKPMIIHCTGKRKSWHDDPGLTNVPDVYDKEYYRFAFVETPWAVMTRPISRKAEMWFRDGRLSRALVRLRRVGLRIKALLARGARR